MVLHSYTHILALTHKALERLWEGTVYVTEKIDGSQISWGRDENGSLSIRSRHAQIDPEASGMFGKAVDTIVGLALHWGWTYRGEFLCLSGDTRVKKCSGGANQKYMTLRTLYALQNEPVKQGYKARGIRKRAPRQARRRTRWEKDGFPQLYSLDLGTDKVVSNRISAVVFSGQKEVICLQTRRGHVIKTTRDHLFWTPYGWRKAGSLVLNDCVGVVDSSFYRVKKISRSGTEETLLSELRKNGSCERCGIDRCLEAHHVDGDRSNNAPDNLQVLCKDCHGQIRRKKPRRTDDYEFDKIVDIQPIGTEDCYDVAMEGNESVASFVAEGFIVHNCKPKHNTLCYERVPKGNIILFDIDRGDQDYMGPNDMAVEANHLGLECVPLFGVFDEHPGASQLMGFLDTESILGGTKVEGIVCKNYSLFGEDGKVLMGKLVREDFKEVHKADWKQRNPSPNNFVEELAERYHSEARWRKAVQHLEEAGVLTHAPQDIPALLQEVNRDVLEECGQEIADILFKYYWKRTISRTITKNLPEWWKGQLGYLGSSQAGQ